MQYLKLMRIKHYLKNLIVFMPLFFSKKLFDAKLLLITILGFISFCLISSIVYIINDIRDLEFDKKHIEKKTGILYLYGKLPGGTELPGRA